MVTCLTLSRAVSVAVTRAVSEEQLREQSQEQSPEQSPERLQEHCLRAILLRAGTYLLILNCASVCQFQGASSSHDSCMRSKCFVCRGVVQTLQGTSLPAGCALPADAAQH